VIGAVLGVVFDDEDGGFGPVGGAGEAVDDNAEGVVVGGDGGLGVGAPGRVPWVWSSPRLMTE
jgi:hypothetical protein